MAAQYWIRSSSNLDNNGLTAKQVFERVCQVRSEKLPDPAKLGNAGSFLKSHYFSATLLKLQQTYPDIVPTPPTRGKNCSWVVNRSMPTQRVAVGAEVHQNQALVLVNKGHASSDDVVKLAAKVYCEVFKNSKFNLSMKCALLALTQKQI